MLKTLLTILFGALVLNPLYAADLFENETTSIEINGAISAMFYQTKDDDGASDKALGNGGEDAELEFEATQWLGDNIEGFLAIEISSDILSAKEGEEDESPNNAGFEAIFVGVQGNFGRLMLTQNEEDSPFDNAVAEALEDINEFDITSVSKATGADHEADMLDADDNIIGEAEVEADDVLRYAHAQYLFPIMDFGTFEIALGKNLNDADEQFQQSYIFSTNFQDMMGINLGYQRFNTRYEDDEAALRLDSYGGSLWWITGDFTFIALYVDEEVAELVIEAGEDDAEPNGEILQTKYYGIGMTYDRGIGTFKAAVQKVNPKEDDEDDRTEWSAGFERELYEGLTVFIEGVWYDQEKNAGDTFGVGFQMEI